MIDDLSLKAGGRVGGLKPATSVVSFCDGAGVHSLTAAATGILDFGFRILDWGTVSERVGVLGGIGLSRAAEYRRTPKRWREGLGAFDDLTVLVGSRRGGPLGTAGPTWEGF